MKRILGLKWPYAAVLATTGLALVVLRVVFFRPFDAPSVSMVPSINMGDHFIVAKRAYASHDPERGDVIVFRAQNEDYVKRVVGIPGDRVQMRHGVLFLDGKAVPRRRVADFQMETDFGPRAEPQYEETLPSGRRYRTLDLVADSGEDDTQEFVVPPNSYFVLGDNRDNSNDSRLDIGFVARESIVGRVVVKYIDGRRGAPAWEAVD